MVSLSHQSPQHLTSDVRVPLNPSFSLLTGQPEVSTRSALQTSEESLASCHTFSRSRWFFGQLTQLLLEF